MLDSANGMSSNTVSSLGHLKTVSGPTQLLPPIQSQASGAISSSDGHTQRRSGGSFSAGPGDRVTFSGPRNNHSSGKQHNNQKRPKLQGDEGAASESAVLRSSTSRKGQLSITHLMNFTLPPRPPTQFHSHHGRNGRRNPTWGVGSGYHAVDKARYIHANYRFIVDPRGEYRTQAVDADVHLDWDNVLQILASAQSQSTNCPICLSVPVAPRMAKCGHMFCLPCLIRFMHSTDNIAPLLEKKARSKKCPICWDGIYLSETRPVRWFTGQEGDVPSEGSDVVLRLVERQTGSTLALPRDRAEYLSEFGDIPWYFTAEVTDYARVMKGSEKYMLSQYDREIEELILQEKEDEIMFGERNQWTQKAISTIREAMEKAKGLGDPPTIPKKPEDKNRHRAPIKYNEEVPEFYSIQQAAKSGQSIGIGTISHHPSVGLPPVDQQSPSQLQENKCLSQQADPRALNPPARFAHIPPVKISAASRVLGPSESLKKSDQLGCHGSPFYFYQALLHYYLSPLDIRILKTAFGDFASFPATVLPRVERVSTGHIVDEDLRKRAKYLAHLPQGCEVGFLECNWAGVVVPEVLDGFKEDIERRRKKNHDKQAREEKERSRAEKDEDEKKWAAARRKRPSISQYSDPGKDQRGCQESGEGMDSIGSDILISAPSPPWQSSRPDSGAAFASLASPSASLAGAKTVWGTASLAPVSPSTSAARNEREVLEDDGWLQGWERDLLRDEEELVSEIEAASLVESKPHDVSSIGNGKKKKKQRITLMTTNGRRGL